MCAISNSAIRARDPLRKPQARMRSTAGGRARPSPKLSHSPKAFKRFLESRFLQELLDLRARLPPPDSRGRIGQRVCGHGRDRLVALQLREVHFVERVRRGVIVQHVICRILVGHQRRHALEQRNRDRRFRRPRRMCTPSVRPLSAAPAPRAPAPTDPCAHRASIPSRAPRPNRKSRPRSCGRAPRDARARKPPTQARPVPHP